MNAKLLTNWYSYSNYLQKQQHQQQRIQEASKRKKTKRLFLLSFSLNVTMFEIFIDSSIDFQTLGPFVPYIKNSVIRTSLWKRKC